MAALRNEVKQFITQALACYDTPTQVSDAVKEEFGIVVPRQQVAAYDPTKYAGRDLSKRWRVVFEDTRKRFREETAEIPIAQRSARLRVLERMAAKAESMRNIPLVVQILEQAAKEVGDIFVNRQRTDGKEGGEQAQPTQVVMTVVDARKHDDS